MGCAVRHKRAGDGMSGLAISMVLIAKANNFDSLSFEYRKNSETEKGEFTCWAHWDRETNHQCKCAFGDTPEDALGNLIKFVGELRSISIPALALEMAS